MTAAQEVVTEAPAVEAVPKRAMTLGYGTSLVMLGLLIVGPSSGPPDSTRRAAWDLEYPPRAKVSFEIAYRK
jgi:hypothetical protein